MSHPLHKLITRDLLLLFASVFILLASHVTYAQKTYTYVGANFDRLSPPYDTSMRITGSFTVLDEFDITSSVKVEPLRYSFSDGVQNFDETNSQITLYVAVDRDGNFNYWDLEVSNYPRASDTDLSPRGWMVSESTYRDAVYYRPCDEGVADVQGICKELLVNVTSPATGITRTWTASGPGLPDGANTLLHYEGLSFRDILASGDISYSTNNRVTGTVVIKGAVTARGNYSDLLDTSTINADIIAFSFSDGINSFDENNAHICAAGDPYRVKVGFDENGAVSNWDICLSTRNLDNSYQDQWGIISSKSGSSDEGVFHICNEYDPLSDSCKIGQSEQTSARIYPEKGTWTVTPPQPPDVVEDCSNGVDDDGDGLVDDADPDCDGTTGLLVRCIHQPLWPEQDEQVVLRAEAIDAHGEPLEVDNIEIYTGDPSNPIATQAGGTDLEITVTAASSTLSYGCQAGVGSEGFSSGTRSVDVGAPELPDKRAIAVIYNGKSEDKIDIVFIPEASRHGVGAGAWDTFLSDIYEVIRQGVYGIPWFVKNQRDINLWLGRDLGKVTPSDPDDRSKKCKKEKPEGFSKYYAFAEASGIIHDKDCRDNSAMKYFSTKYVDFIRGDDNQKISRLQVVAHEIGHAAFTLSDEYIGASTLYFTIEDHPNLFPTKSVCRSAAEKRGHDPDRCRDLVADGAKGFIAGGRWIFEPNYRIDAEPWTEVRDLMQQTGGEGQCESSGDTPVPFACIYRYRVGISESARMERKVEKCRAGRC
ncbi:MAG: hypothetical protein V2I26_08095 [Halieaceae bacterium]|jgi:hypothetical protein|nr:hypothetical protein [Halieaceae bacterium]